MTSHTWRQQLCDYIRRQALPVDKFSHQPRLYALACSLGTNLPYDDDILFAACWLHDLGVFVGHRPEDLQALAKWDNVAYAIAQAPTLLKSWGFPVDKITAVQEAIQQHHPQARPTNIEAILLHDADILELIGAVGLLRAISKVGRDSRFTTFHDVLPVLERYLQFESDLLTEPARELAQPRLALVRQFIMQAKAESQGMQL